MTVFVFFLFGLAIGSFVAALTYRLPKNLSIAKGRSFCDKCLKPIKWYDNIPLFSYLLLGGKCRFCHKKISPRYFWIELSMGFLYASTYIFFSQIVGNIPWLNSVPVVVGLLYLLAIITLLFGIFVIDLEHQFIPDEFVYVGILLTLITLFISDSNQFYYYLLGALSGSFFLLSVHLLTKGKGMGLGDVKLAILIGMILGFSLMVVWMFSSFVLGSIVGIYLLMSKKTKLKQRIAFGPFLISGFVLVSVLGNQFIHLFFPI